MSRSWNPKEDRFLLSLVEHCRHLGWNRSQTFEQTAKRLKRTPGACFARWKALTVCDRRKVSAKTKGQEFPKLQERIRHLEEKLKDNQEQMKDLIEQNRRMREEMRFFEIMLLEEYQLLISLLEQKQSKAKLQSL